jgi:hypothetical protein
MEWSPVALAAGLAALFAVIVGRVRHESGRAIAVTATGLPLFLIGLGWASQVSTDAFPATGYGTWNTGSGGFARLGDVSSDWSNVIVT